MKTYGKHKFELLGMKPEGYVLIKENKIIDTFCCEEDALSSGYKTLGNVPFLVKKITQFDEIIQL